MSNQSDPLEPVDCKDAWQAITKAASLLNFFWCRSPQKALETILPFALRDDYVAREPYPLKIRHRIPRRLKGVVRAVTADCYRALGDFEAAALWYYGAGELKKFRGFAPIYADMALQHYLSDHYRSAHWNLRADIRHDRNTSRCVRYLHVFWAGIMFGEFLRPSEYQLMFRCMFRKQQLLTELEARLAETSAMI